MSDLRYEASLQMMLRPDNIFAKAQASPGELFRWVLSQILLGKQVESAKALLDQHIAAFTLAGKPSEAIRDMQRWGNIAATMQLMRQQPDHLTHQLLQYLPVYEVREQKYQIVQHMLALTTLTHDTAMRKKWQQAAYRLPLPDDLDALDHLDVTHELLYLTDASVQAGADCLEDLALACARLSHSILLGLPVYSAAPLVLVLADLAKKRGTTIATLLTKRLDALDTVVFGETAAPRIEIKQLPYVAKQASFGIVVEARGVGALRSGALGITPLTCGLPVVVFRTRDALGTSRSPKKQAQFSMLEDALYTEQGEIVAELRTTRDIVCDDTSTSALDRRIRVAWQYVQGYDPNVIGHIRPAMPDAHR